MARQRYAPAAMYRNNLVAIKKVAKRNVDLNRNVLMELKQVS